MGGSASRAVRRVRVPLSQVERIYSLPPEQLVRFSMMCEAQQRLESQLDYMLDELPAADEFSLTWQRANRMILRAMGCTHVVKDTWVVTHQTEDTIELHTADWCMRQEELPFVSHEEPGRWMVGIVSAVGICLRRYGTKATDVATTIWGVHESSTDTIVLHSIEWYREQRREQLRSPPATPPTTPVAAYYKD